MAAAPFATTTSPFFLHSPIITTKSSKTIIHIVSSISISRPRKPNTRKNYLRPKILKTISIPNQNPKVSIFLPLEQDLSLPSIDQFPKVNELEIQDVGIASGKVSRFSEKGFLKYGLWLVGAFVLQTVCAIWVFGLDDNKGKYQTLDNEDENNPRINKTVNGKVVLDNEGTTLIGIDEPMQKKIEEIRIMAREARDSERLEREKNGLDGNESGAIFSLQSSSW